MYFSDEVLAEVRSRNEILDVIGSYVKLKRSGATYFGLCPFHNEKTPSFSVTPGKQMFYCFGCHKGGNVITFVQEYENMSFTEAVRFLAERAGIALPEEELTPERKREQDRRALLLEANKQAGVYYYYNLRSKAGEQGLTYLQGRGLSDETIRNFGLGYAGKYSDGLYKYLKSKNFSDELLRQTGLMSADEKKGMYDRFWNRVMFPIMDVNNRIIGFGGRVMGDAKPKYLNSPENEIFNKRRNLYGLNIARRTRERFLILCEGYMDVISMHQAGFTNAVASLGTALTQEHAALLRRYTDTVIISYDSDTAGEDAALRAIPMLRDSGITTRVLRLAPYKDPDEFIKAEGTEAFRKRIEEAQNAFLFEIELLKREFNDKDPDSRTRFQQQTAEKIAQFELEAQRDNYITAVCEEYSISRDALRQMVDRALHQGVFRPATRDPETVRIRKEKDDGLAVSQSLIMTWLTVYPHFYGTLKQFLEPEDFSEGLYRTCARILYEQLEQGKLDEAGVIDRFEDLEDRNTVAGFFHARLDVQDDEQTCRAMRENIRKVFDAGLAQQANPGQEQSIEGLQRMIARRKKIEGLARVQFDLAGAAG